MRDQQRFGSVNDGGYIVPKRLLKCCRTLLSFGINFDWEFEEDVVRQFPWLEVRSFDGSTSFARAVWWGATRFAYSPISWKRSHLAALRKPFDFLTYSRHHRVRHQPKFIGTKASRRTAAIKDVVAMASLGGPIVVKMDVEGAEYDILEPLLEFQTAIVGIIVEFHNLDTRYDAFTGLIGKCQQHFDITHLHANNCDAVTINALPKVLEATLMRRDLGAECQKWQGETYYLSIDAPNDPTRPDTRITFDE
jgi:hypothetical protein